MAGSSLLDEAGGSLFDESGSTLRSEDFVAGSAPMALDRYAPKRRRVARMIARWRTGVITLTRETPGALPNAEEPWVLGAPVLDVYELDARSDGVIEKYDPDATIEGASEMLIVSPKARHTLSAGVAVEGTPVVDLVPDKTDVLEVDGRRRVLIKVEAVPAAGLAARFHIFVGA